MLPKAPANYLQERKGIVAVATAALTMGGHIWRETPNADVGIDGQLEFVDESGFATGHTLAVQVKSGPSYFQNESPTHVKYYPAEKHRQYWERFPLPVILILHNPDSDTSIWVDARQHLRNPGTAMHAYIAVPKSAVLQKATRNTLFENLGLHAEKFIPSIPEVLTTMVRKREPSNSFSFFDLFTHVT